MATSDPHQNQPIATAGVPLDQAEAAMILVHGRGASAADILTLTHELNGPGFAYLAPQAAGHTWYPYSFLSPLSQNEPYLSSALQLVDDVVGRVVAAGLAHEKVMLLGFSQGACLALEYSARHARRYGGVVALSGGLIGPPGTTFAYEGSLEGTPIFLGCSDIDPHIPLERVEESARAVKTLGAAVTTRIYPRMGHTVNQDEIEFVQEMMDALRG